MVFIVEFAHKKKAKSTHQRVRRIAKNILEVELSESNAQI